MLPHFQAIGRRALRSFRLSTADADDVLADSLASLYRGGLAQFRGETLPQFLAFLKAVVRNRAMDVIQQGRKWPSNPVDPGQPARDIAGSTDVSHDLAGAECLEFLWQEVGRLRREDRELYLMKARGMKEREIVEQTGRPPGTVSSQIARLLERLRSALRERGCL